MAAVLVFTIVIFIEFPLQRYVCRWAAYACRVRTKVKYEPLSTGFILLHCVGHTFASGLLFT